MSVRSYVTASRQAFSSIERPFPLECPASYEPESPTSYASGANGPRSSQENAVKAIFDSACSGVVDIIATLQLELSQVQNLARVRGDKLDALTQTVGRLENTIQEQNKMGHGYQEDIAELKVELNQTRKETSRRIADLESDLETQKTEHETTMQEIQMEHADAMSKQKAHWEIKFDSLNQQLSDEMKTLIERKDAEKAALKQAADAKLAEIEAFWEQKLNAVTQQLTAEKKAEAERYEDLLQQAEEAHTQKVATVEEIWSQRYAQVRQKAERTISELKAFKQKNSESRHKDLEALELRGKETAQLMEQAMKLIRQAQDENYTERLRFRPLDEPDLSASVLAIDKENELPSPTAIRTSYVAPLKAGLPPATITTPRLRAGSLNLCTSLGVNALNTSVSRIPPPAVLPVDLGGRTLERIESGSLERST